MRITPKAMRYIVRIDSHNTHCYNVRIGYKIKSKVNKSFADGRYGGTVNALIAAKKWRNQQLKKLLPVMQEEYEYDQNGQRFWGTGVNESWCTKKGWEYLYIRATYYDGARKKQLIKSFSVLKYGYDEAFALATQWRKLKLTGEL